MEHALLYLLHHRACPCHSHLIACKATWTLWCCLARTLQTRQLPEEHFQCALNDVISISLPSPSLQGNVDPMVLFGPPSAIEAAVKACVAAAGGRRHILNVGHGVVQVSERPPGGSQLEARLTRSQQAWLGACVVHGLQGARVSGPSRLQGGGGIS